MEGPHLLELVRDGLGLLVPLEPHHVLGVEPPRLLLQGLGCQVLRLSALGEEGCSGGSGDPPDGRGKRDGQGIRADPGPRHRPRWVGPSSRSRAGHRTYQCWPEGKGDRRWECFQRSLEKEERLMHEECSEEAA